LSDEISTDTRSGGRFEEKGNKLQTSMKNNIKIFMMRFGPAILLMAVIFTFSSIPEKGLPDFGAENFTYRKSSHAIGYMLLAPAYLIAIGEKRPRAWLWAFLLAILYAMSDEFHQSFTPGRTPRLFDVGVDTIGSSLGLTFAHFWPRKNRE
jgi:hypothetical protein